MLFFLFLIIGKESEEENLDASSDWCWSSYEVCIKKQKKKKLIQSEFLCFPTELCLYWELTFTLHQ